MGRCKGNTGMKQFILVTNDIYELPLSLPMNVHEMAKLLGTSEQMIRWKAGNYGNKRYCKNQAAKGKLVTAIKKKLPYKVRSFWPLPDEEGEI